jgi:prepilin-type N-terminal cleavage/methylation domain-containing protein
MKNPRGFTLVETLIVIFLFSLIMLAVVDLYVGFNKSYSKQSASINTSLSAAALVDEVKRLALQANAVVASRAFNGVTHTSSATTLVLSLPSIDASGNILSAKYDYAAFYLTGSTTYRILEVDASSARPSGSRKLSDVVSDLLFTYNNVTPSLATMVTVDATTSSIAEQQLFQTHLTQRINLRNI